MTETEAPEPDPETDLETPEESADPEEAQADSDEQPDIDDDEMADLGELASEVEEKTRPDGDGEEAEDTEPTETDEPMGYDREKVSPGKIYTNVLGMGAAVARDELGSGVDSKSEAMNEYAEMARDLEIDQYVDEWMDQHGGPDALSPGQAIIVMSIMFGGMVLMDDPDMVAEIAGGKSNE